MNRSEQSEEERIQAEQRAEEGWQRGANGAKVSASERATDAWRRLELELELARVPGGRGSGAVCDTHRCNCP